MNNPDEPGNAVNSSALEEAQTLRLQAEEKARSVEAFLDSMIDQSPHPTWISDSDGTLIRLNEACRRLLNITDAEVVGKYNIFQDSIVEQQGLLPLVRRVFEAGETVQFELTYDSSKLQGLELAHAVIVYLSVTMFAVRGADGRVEHAVIQHLDTTERRRAEEALQASEARLRTLIDTIPDLVWLKDASGVYLGCNRRFESFFGAKQDEIAGKTDYDFVDKNLADSFRDHDRAAMAAGRPTMNEEWITFAEDGHEELLETIKTPIYGSDGRLMGVLGVGRDITARKRAEEEARERESFIRTVLDNLPVGIAVNSLDPALHFGYMNDNFAKLYRVTREALSDTNAFWEAVYEEPDFRKEMRNRVVGDCASGDPARMYWADVPITRKGDKTTFITAQNVPIPNSPLVISMVWDVTDRKQAEADREKLQVQLVQAQKMESVGRLAGGVAHDFNNMLNVIIGHADLALETVTPEQPIYADLVEIRQAAQRSANLTRQLLAFARKQTVSPKILDLNETLQGMLAMLQRLIGEDINLIWAPGADLWPVRIDPSQLDQVLANLCINARDAIGGIGRVTIETQNATIDKDYSARHTSSAPGDFVMLAVSDNGCGMDRETQEHLFEPFFTTKDVGRGTGLGLATVYGAVTQNGGWINVYSELGQGSTFKIYLPRHIGDATETRVNSREKPAQHGTETVLLVEDEAAILNMGRRMLEGLGYHVLAAATPGEALRAAEQHTGEIHLLVTDMVMPEMNGRDLAQRLLALHPHLKQLFMSGYTTDVIAHQGVLDKGIHFMQKPFTKNDLAAKVRAALDQQ